MANLLEQFQLEAKKHQLFIQMPLTAALIYAKNDKKGSYCGFFKDIPLNTHFEYKDFLAAQALPGPDSVVHCHLYLNGPDGGS